MSASNPGQPVESREGQYRVNEIFYSIQGEGVNTGKPMVFVRLSGCNLRCTKSSVGFDCDTEFESGNWMSRSGLLREVDALTNNLRPNFWVLFTGGEPAAQLDRALVKEIHRLGARVAIETNGTIKLPDGIDWVCVSPKTAWHTISVRRPDEIKLVRRKGQSVPNIFELYAKYDIRANNYVVSPAFEADGSVKQDTIEHCVELVKNNGYWRLSLQTHKLIGVR